MMKTPQPPQKATEHPGDTQKVELLGRNRLIDEIIRDDLEVALPVRDRGIDLIAYSDLVPGSASYIARPIQMKAAWTRSFMIERRYAKFPGLILAFVWHLDDRERAVTYAMSYSETVTLADELGWTKTVSWEGGRYATTRPSALIVEMLEPFRMTPGKWRRLILGPVDVSTRPAL